MTTKVDFIKSTVAETLVIETLLVMKSLVIETLLVTETWGLESCQRW